MQSQIPIRDAILITIAYFDHFDYPLTYFEIWKWLMRHKTRLNEVILATDGLVADGLLEHKNGSFFLPGRSRLFDLRQDQYDWSQYLWERALRASRIISCLPFIEMVSIVNSVAVFNSDEDSDIDFLIVAKRGHIWTVRATTAVLLHLFRLRRHGQKTKSRACLSFYISNDALNLALIAQDEYALFVAYFVAQTTPIFDRNDTFKKYITANAWTRDFLPNTIPAITNYYHQWRYPWLAKVIQPLARILLAPRFVEWVARSLQQRKIRASQNKWGDPDSVITNDQMLKFHPIDHRPKYLAAILEKLRGIDSRLAEQLKRSPDRP